MNKVPVSVIVPAYNEERNIGDCLQSVSWADEVMVVDGGSRDRTREIAGRYTSHILVTENSPAETQRLKAIEQVKHPWFLLLDADERVDEELRREIERVVEPQEGPVAYFILRKNLYRNRAVHLHHPDYHLRLFKKDSAVSLPTRIHRTPLLPHQAGTLKGALLHHFFPSMEEYLAKLNRYTSIEVSYWREEGRTLRGGKALYDLTIRPAGRFFQYYFLKRGFLDGFFGLFYSLSSAFYEVIVAARAMLDETRTNSGSAPAERERTLRQ